MLHAKQATESGKFAQFVQYYRQHVQLKREAQLMVGIAVSLLGLSYLPIPIITTILFYFATTYCVSSAIDLWATWRLQRQTTLYMRWVNAFILRGGLMLIQKLAEVIHSFVYENQPNPAHAPLAASPDVARVSPALANLGAGSHAGEDLEDAEVLPAVEMNSVVAVTFSSEPLSSEVASNLHSGSKQVVVTSCFP